MGGNQFGDKLNPEQKQLAFKQYCNHIASGLSKEAWYYEDSKDENLSLTHKTMESYIKNDPEAFPTSQLENAYSKSRAFFEKIGIDIMTGANPKGNPATFQIFMRNKFGWDRDHSKDQDKEINVMRQS